MLSIDKKKLIVRDNRFRRSMRIIMLKPLKTSDLTLRQCSSIKRIFYSTVVTPNISTDKMKNLNHYLNVNLMWVNKTHILKTWMKQLMKCKPYFIIIIELIVLFRSIDEMSKHRIAMSQTPTLCNMKKVFEPFYRNNALDHSTQ